MVQIVTMNSELYDKFAKIIRQDSPIHMMNEEKLANLII